MLDISKWKEFVVEDIFECSTTKAVGVDEISDGEIVYITRSALDNGCSGYLSDIPGKKEKGNCITIGAEGKVAFYQEDDFLPGVKVYTLRNEHINQKTGMFVCTILNASVFKYSYGRARILEKIKKEIIPLPVTKSGDPDWEYMEEYINEIQTRSRKNEEALDEAIKTNNKANKIDTSNWKEFSLNDLFEISGSKTTKVDELEGYGNGKNPYVTTKATNNGVDGFYDFYTEEGNCLTIDSAVLGYCTYQPVPFTASDHVEVLRPKFQMNKYIALFFVTIINKDTYRYSYGRKRSQKQIKRDTVKLPVDSHGDPDWSFMERYIKSLPFGDKI